MEDQIWGQLARISVMSRDSLVSSLPSQGWSCQTLEEGVEMAAQKAGLSLNPNDFKQAGVALLLMGFLWGYIFKKTWKIRQLM